MYSEISQREVVFVFVFLVDMMGVMGPLSGRSRGQCLERDNIAIDSDYYTITSVMLIFWLFSRY